jgi:hypothetical protein
MYGCFPNQSTTYIAAIMGSTPPKLKICVDQIVQGQPGHRSTAFNLAGNLKAVYPIVRDQGPTCEH